MASDIADAFGGIKTPPLLWMSILQQEKSYCQKESDIETGAKTHRNHIAPVTSVVASAPTAYCLRHTHATDLQTAGLPINMAENLLRHPHITMSARMYTHLSEAAFTAAAEKVYALGASVQIKVGDAYAITEALPDACASFSAYTLAEAD